MLISNLILIMSILIVVLLITGTTYFILFSSNKKYQYYKIYKLCFNSLSIVTAVLLLSSYVMLIVQYWFVNLQSTYYK